MCRRQPGTRPPRSKPPTASFLGVRKSLPLEPSRRGEVRGSLQGSAPPGPADREQQPERGPPGPGRARGRGQPGRGTVHTGVEVKDALVRERKGNPAKPQLPEEGDVLPVGQSCQRPTAARKPARLEHGPRRGSGPTALFSAFARGNKPRLPSAPGSPSEKGGQQVAAAPGLVCQGREPARGRGEASEREAGQSFQDENPTREGTPRGQGQGCPGCHHPASQQEPLGPGQAIAPCSKQAGAEEDAAEAARRRGGSCTTALRPGVCPGRERQPGRLPGGRQSQIQRAPQRLCSPRPASRPPPVGPRESPRRPAGRRAARGAHHPGCHAAADARTGGRAAEPSAQSVPLSAARPGQRQAGLLPDFPDEGSTHPDESV